MVDVDGLWESHADWWDRGFTQGVDPEYEEQILPLASQLLDGFDRVLDIGTGEGQVARRVAGDVGTVVGFDPTAELITRASERGGGPEFVLADAAAIPACLLYTSPSPRDS